MHPVKTVWISFDVECTGPVPSLHAMVDLGMVAIVERDTPDGPAFEMLTSFQALIKPPPETSWHRDTHRWWKSPEQADAYEQVFCPELQVEPVWAMRRAIEWLTELQTLFPGVPHVFAAYPASFDWPFLNHYMHAYSSREWLKLYPEGPGVMQRIACFDIASLGMNLLGVGYHEVSSGRMAGLGPALPENRAPHTALADAVEQGHLLINLLTAAASRTGEVK